MFSSPSLQKRTRWSFITISQTLWRLKKHLPFVISSLLYRMVCILLHKFLIPLLWWRWCILKSGFRNICFFFHNSYLHISSEDFQFSLYTRSYLSFSLWRLLIDWHRTMWDVTSDCIRRRYFVSYYNETLLDDVFVEICLFW